MWCDQINLSLAVKCFKMDNQWENDFAIPLQVAVDWLAQNDVFKFYSDSVTLDALAFLSDSQERHWKWVRRQGREEGDQRLAPCLCFVKEEEWGQWHPENGSFQEAEHKKPDTGAWVR